MSDVTKGAIVVRSAEAGRLVGFANRGTAEERRQAIKDGLKASRETEPEMSDVDRLREAAEWLDKKPLLTWESVMQYDGYPSLVPRQYPEVADLLRAVADATHEVGESGVGWVLHQYGIPAAARALADTILPIPHCCADWECGFVTPPDRDHCGCFAQVTHPFGACQRQGRKRDGTLSEVGEQ